LHSEALRGQWQLANFLWYPYCDSATENAPDTFAVDRFLSGVLSLDIFMSKTDGRSMAVSAAKHFFHAFQSVQCVS
jgi:hypothetical protein